jgi:hypothetical protein
MKDRQALVHEYVVGRMSLHDDTQKAESVCEPTITLQLGYPSPTHQAGAMAVLTSTGEPTDTLTCPKCIARRRCHKGTATDLDRLLLATVRKHDKLGPVERRACAVHAGSTDKIRYKWTEERRPTAADIVRVERCIESSELEWAADISGEHTAGWQNVVAVLQSIRQERLAGAVIVNPIELIVDQCFICKMKGSKT